MSEIVLAMFFGVIGSITYHISKGMERHGIEIYDRIIAMVKNKETTNTDKKKITKPIIYIVGIILNNSLIIWIILSNRYAPTSYFTSMFGVGLIALMIYGSVFLKESITKIEYLGAVILIGGTVLLGIDGIGNKADMSQVNMGLLWLITAVFFSFVIFGMIMAVKKNSQLLISIFFGVFTGAAACMDPILKGIGQHKGGMAGFLPSTFEGWLIFALSFVFSSTSFIFTQFSFYKRVRVSVIISIQTSIYVSMPIVLQLMILPGYTISLITFIGLALIFTGIFLMRVVRIRIP